MKLKITNDNRQFEVYLDFAVLDGLSGCLYAASYAGVQTAVKAVSASIISGYEGTITTEDDRNNAFYSFLGGYKRVEAPLEDGIYHGVIIAKGAVVKGAADEENKNPVILAPDGDIEAAVGRYLAARYNLPQEWIDEYYHLLDPRYDIKRLDVLADPRGAWSKLKAVRLQMYITEDYIQKKLEEKLKSGPITIPSSPVEGKFDPSWTTNEYLKANAPILGEQLSKTGALFMPGKDELSPHFASMGRISFPAQAFVAQGVINSLKKNSYAFICGDMGTGKTQIANGIVHVLHKEKGIRRVLITAPGMVVPKWAHEIRMTVPYAKIKVFNSTQDALKFAREVKSGKAPKNLEVVLVGIDRVKLGPEPWFAGVWRRVKDAKYSAWHCPDCYEPLPCPDEYKDVTERVKHDPQAKPDIYAAWGDLVEGRREQVSGKLFELGSLPNTPGGVPVNVRWNRKSKIRKCPYCGTRLWRPANKNRLETQMKTRWFICRVLKNLGKVFDLYIADEIHQTKAGDSGRGYAFGQLAKCAKKVIGLTGTLTTGKSTSIREILWRLDAALLLKNGIGHKNVLEWAARYGVLEKTYDKDNADITDDGVITIRRGSRCRVRELPGISPEMTANYLLDKAVFMELGDLGLPLVELKEIPLFIEMDEEHGEEYQRLHTALHSACARAAAAGNPGAFSQFIPTTINYADRPDLGAEAEVGDDVFTATSFDPEYYHAKERKLVELVKKELAEGRGVAIYTKYSQKYRINKRIQKVLKEHGIKSVVLTTSTGPDKRMEWLEEQAKKGTKVIICNLELVETGLDLLYWPTIIFYQLDYRVNDVRQASRRSWRIGQTKECRIYYMVYNKTQQMAQFKHIMKGRGHAMFVEGRLDRSELARYSVDEKTSMAYDIAMCLAESDLANRWVELAQKDIDKDLKLVSEEKFEEALQETKKQLVEETMRLCGVTEPIPAQEPVSEAEEADLFAGAGEEADIEEASFLDLFTGIEERPSDLLDLEKGEFFPGYGREDSSNRPAKKKVRRRRRRKKNVEGQLSIFDFIENAV